MKEFWNFNDAIIVAEHNWLWLLFALVIGLLIGWFTCRPRTNNS